MLMARTLRGNLGAEETVQLSPGFVQTLKDTEATETALKKIATTIANIKDSGGKVPAILVARYNEIYNIAMPLAVSLANDYLETDAKTAAPRMLKASTVLSVPPIISIRSVSGLADWMIPAQDIEFVFYNEKSKVDFLRDQLQPQSSSKQVAGLGEITTVGAIIIASVLGVVFLASVCAIMYWGFGGKYRDRESSNQTQAALSRENSARLERTTTAYNANVAACREKSKTPEELKACVNKLSADLESALKATVQEKYKPPTDGMGVWGYVGIAAAGGLAVLLIANYLKDRR